RRFVRGLTLAERTQKVRCQCAEQQSDLDLVSLFIQRPQLELVTKAALFTRIQRWNGLSIEAAQTCNGAATKVLQEHLLCALSGSQLGLSEPVEQGGSVLAR